MVCLWEYMFHPCVHLSCLTSYQPLVYLLSVVLLIVFRALRVRLHEQYSLQFFNEECCIWFYFDWNELLQIHTSRGKFGNVYKCRQKTTGSIWAAKVVKCREKEKDVVRQEINIMNRLAHPKLLMLWDAFEAPRTMVLVME